MMFIDFSFQISCSQGQKPSQVLRFKDYSIVQIINSCYLTSLPSPNLLDDKLFRLEQNNGADKHLELASSTANPKE